MLVCYYQRMKTSKNKTSPTHISRSVQKWFVVTALAAYGLQTAVPVYYAVTQYQHNPNLSSYLLWFLSVTIAPLVFAATAWRLHPRRSQVARLQMWFETLVLTMVGLAFYGIISQVQMFVQQFFVPVTGGYWGYVGYQVAGFGLTVLIYVSLLLRLRKRNAW